MGEFLFDEFDQVTARQWKQKIQFDLKGADYNETLLWESNEGIKVKPFYHLDDFEMLEIPKFEGQASICQSIFISDEHTANFLAKDALKRGATTIQFEANEPFEIALVLQDIKPGDVGRSVYFKLNFLSENFHLDVIQRTKAYATFLNVDPIGNLVKDGNWFRNKEADFELLNTLLSKASERTHIMTVDAGHYQNAGANSVQQIAYALSHANEYLHAFMSNEIQSIGTLRFDFAVGSNYFFEIAKLRAFRYLWSLLCEEYKLSIEPHIFASPSLRNKTLYDYNTNMLRTTTECMSALLGGANVISNVAYDAVYHKKNEFGERIARNQLLILQEESYFKEASNFPDGAYYIESLTKQLAEKALELFKDIENSGGFLKQVFEGTIQRKIAQNAVREQEHFDSGHEVLLGTNKHPNQNDRMKNELELYPFIKTKPRKTLVQPIIAKRLAEPLEQERLKKEN
ncbi:MAG: methylmalonyl-CoA mutase subunit beta [Flavobacteriaceae bacterium]|nr:methylmalonyl-CoA mutase subunit beta [Flavobacteriaceae bacterium]